MGITRGFIEGFLKIRSGGPDIGYPRGPGRGPKILKKFFPEFFFYFVLSDTIRESLNYPWKGIIALKKEVFKGFWILEDDRPLQTASLSLLF